MGSLSSFFFLRTLCYFLLSCPADLTLKLNKGKLLFRNFMRWVKIFYPSPQHLSFTFSLFIIVYLLRIFNCTAVAMNRYVRPSVCKSVVTSGIIVYISRSHQALQVFTQRYSFAQVWFHLFKCLKCRILHIEEFLVNACTQHLSFSSYFSSILLSCQMTLFMHFFCFCCSYLSLYPIFLNRNFSFCL